MLTERISKYLRGRVSSFGERLKEARFDLTSSPELLTYLIIEHATTFAYVTTDENFINNSDLTHYIDDIARDALKLYKSFVRGDYKSGDLPPKLKKIYSVLDDRLKQFGYDHRIVDVKSAIPYTVLKNLKSIYRAPDSRLIQTLEIAKPTLAGLVELTRIATLIKPEIQQLPKNRGYLH